MLIVHSVSEINEFQEVRRNYNTEIIIYTTSKLTTTFEHCIEHALVHFIYCAQNNDKITSRIYTDAITNYFIIAHKIFVYYLAFITSYGKYI